MQFDPNRFRPVSPQTETIEYDPNRFVPVNPSEEEAEAPLLQGARGVGKGAVRGLSEAVNLLPNALHAGMDLLGRGITAVDNKLTGADRRFNAGASPGEATNRLLTQAGVSYEDRNQLPEAERLGAAFGEPIGASVPFAALPFALARAGAGAAAPMVQQAANAPRTTAAAEASSAFGAGTGGLAAEALAPGNPLAQAGGELIGAITNPGQYVLKLGQRASSGVLGAVRRFVSKDFQEQLAGKFLRDNLEGMGYTPESILQRIDEHVKNPLSPEYNPTTAQLLDNEAMTAVEARVRADSQKAGSDILRQRQEANQVLRNMADGLAATGDPQNLIDAARIRESYFNNLLRDRVQAAEEAAVRGARNLGTRGPDAQTDASEAVVRVLQDVFDDSIKVQSQLWDRIPKNIISDGSNTLQALQAVNRQVLPNQRPIASDYLNFLDDAAETGQITSRNLLILRRDFLERQSQAIKSGNQAEAARYRQMADAVLEDMAVIPGETAAMARDFSSAMRATFDDTFAGRAIGLGGPSIEPGLVLSRGLGAGGDAAAIRSTQMTEAAGFDSPRAGFEAPPERRAIVRSSQEDWLREQAGRAIDSQTGRANARQLQRFLDNNDKVLADFPRLRQELTETMNAELALRAAEDGRDVASRIFQQQTAFGRLLRGDIDNPSRTVGQVLRGRNAVREYRRLAQLTRARQLDAAGREEARAGLFSATMDAMYREAGGQDLSFTQLQQKLTTPMGRNQPSPLALMRQEGIITREQRTNLEKLLEAGVRSESSAASRAQLDQLLSDPAQLETLMTRIIGARIGSLGAAGAGGSTLIAASAGSTAAQNLLQRIPGRKVQDLVTFAVQDPAVAARLLRKTRGGSELGGELSFITGAMIQAGIITEEDLQDAP